jgi:hypothetical protein
MKKFIISILFSLITLISFSQDVKFGRAYIYYTGINDGTEVVWNEYPTKCDVLVQIEPAEVTIYSEELQVYHIIQIDVREENMARWTAVNKDGIRCYVYMGKYGESNDLGLTIEFGDLAWTYVVTAVD